MKKDRTDISVYLRLPVITRIISVTGFAFSMFLPFGSLHQIVNLYSFALVFAISFAKNDEQRGEG